MCTDSCNLICPQLYDLYYKAIPSWNSGSNRCPKEDAICGQGTAQPACGVNATCEGRWDPDGVSLCRCNPGWYGDKCSKGLFQNLQRNGKKKFRQKFLWEI